MTSEAQQEVRFHLVQVLKPQVAEPLQKQGPTSCQGNELGAPVSLRTQQDCAQTPPRSPPLQTCCSFFWDPALCNQAYFLQGHPALPVPPDFPTWESLTLELFPYGAVCLFSSLASESARTRSVVALLVKSYLILFLLSGWAEQLDLIVFSHCTMFANQ